MEDWLIWWSSFSFSHFTTTNFPCSRVTFSEVHCQWEKIFIQIRRFFHHGSDEKHIVVESYLDSSICLRCEFSSTDGHSVSPSLCCFGDDVWCSACKWHSIWVITKKAHMARCDYVLCMEWRSRCKRSLEIWTEFMTNYFLYIMHVLKNNATRIR